MWLRLAFGCLQLLRNISDEFISHVMKMFKLLQENGFENMCSDICENVFSAGVVLNIRETTWKNEV
jgi:hypothetical protein